MKDDCLKILAERDVKYVELDIDMSEKLRKQLIEYGLREIVTDEDALVNYAFIKALENGIKHAEKIADESQLKLDFKSKKKGMKKNNEDSSDK